MSIGTDAGEVLIPQVIRSGGRWIVGSPQQAIDYYRKTGEHLGVYSSPEAANAAAIKLHEQQAREYLPPVGAAAPAGENAPSAPGRYDRTRTQTPVGDRMSERGRTPRGRAADQGQLLVEPDFQQYDPQRAAKIARERAHPGLVDSTIAGLSTLLATNAAAILTPPVGPTAGFQKRKEREANLLDIGVAKGVAGSVAKDFTDPRRAPLAALDVLGGAGVAGKAFKVGRAVRAAEAGDKAAAAARAMREPFTTADLPRGLAPDASGQRKLRYQGGEIQLPNVSPHPVTLALQHAADRASEAVPGLPLAGSRARVARNIPEALAIKRQRTVAKAIPLDQAARRLRSLHGVTPDEMAYTVIARYGHTGPEGVALLDREIAQKTAAAAAATGRARKRLSKRVQLLQAARERVLSPSPELTAALAEGRALTRGVIEPSKVARGFTTPETMARAEQRHLHFAETGMTQDQYDSLVGAQKDLLVAQHEEDMRNLRGQSRKANRVAANTSAARAKTAKLHARMTALSERLAEENAKFGTMYREGYVTAPRRASAASEAMPLVRQQELVGSLQKQYDRAATAYFRHQGNGGGTAHDLGQMMAAEQERLARAQEDAVAAHYAAVNKVRPADITLGPHGFYTPDFVQNAPGGRGFGRVTSLNAAKQERAHQSTLSLYQHGREAVGPRTTLRDFQREARHLDRAERGKLAHQFSVPYNPDIFNPNEHMLLDEQHALQLPRGSATKIAAEKRQAQAAEPELDIEDLSPQRQIQRWVTEHTDWARKVFPETVAGAEHPLGLRMVDRKIGEAASGLSLAKAMESSPIGRALDFTNNVNRTALIYLSTSYGPVQAAGNLAYLALQQGPFAAANIPKYVRRLTQLDREARARIDLEVGGGAAAHLAHEGRGAGPATRLADVQNTLADKYPREIAWLHEASRRGYTSPAEIEALLTEPKLEATLNEVSNSAQQAMVKFRRTPTATRRTIGRAIFIAPWIEGSTRWLGRLALDRPITARVAEQIRERIAKRQVQKLGLGKAVTGGFVPIGGAFTKNGLRVVPGVNPQAMSPVGTPVELGKAIREAVGGSPAQGGGRLGQLIQPSLLALGEGLSGIDTYNGRRYPKGSTFQGIVAHDLVGSASRPAFPLGATIATALRHPAPPTGPAGKQPTYYPEAGPVDALKRAAFGSARERLVVNDAAQAKGEKLLREGLAPDARVKYDWNQHKQTLGVKQWPVPVRRAINAQAVRAAQRARFPNTEQGRMQADLQAAVQLGLMTPAVAKHTAAQLANAPDSSISDYILPAWSKTLFGGAVLAPITKAAKEKAAAKAGVGK